MMPNADVFQIGVLILFTVVNCDVYTAITSVKNLLNTHENVLSNLDQYIEVEENRLTVMKRYLKEFTDEQKKANKDAQKYVENPINAFTLIKRLSTDLEQLKIVASDTTEFVWDRELLYPTEEDLIGAAVAITRLQYYYKLNATQLAAGNLKGVFGSPMTASDCYNLAMILYKRENAYAAEWLEAALEKFDNVLQYENTFTASEGMIYKEDAEDNIWNEYRELCRGEINFSSANASKLHCLYLKRNPFLRLAPIKMEELRKNPDVFLFHDVLTDREIEKIKEIVSLKLKRITVTKDGVKVTSEGRICKNAFIDEHNDTIEIMKQRIADFTGLSMSYAQLLNVMNYGIGGHFHLHYDGPVLDVGDILATALFYMSDVSLGGATVFPRIPLAVTPRKGTALHWINMHPSGEIDRRMLHGACPVLYGSKWVIQMNILSADQDLLQLCPLSVNKYVELYYY